MINYFAQATELGQAAGLVNACMAKYSKGKERLAMQEKKRKEKGGDEDDCYYISIKPRKLFFGTS